MVLSSWLCHCDSFPGSMVEPMGATENARLELSAPCYWGWKMRDQAVIESQTPAFYGTHNMIYLIFFINVLLYYTLQVSFNTMTVLRSAVCEAKHTYQLWHIQYSKTSAL